ncbi:hypothetical protein Trydic_g23145 [Trypoxylus dichotomus]
MPLDVLGRTRATLKESACLPWPSGPGNPLNLLRARDWGLQLFPMNEEFPVSASHKLALITSLPFVHTARRYYRLNDLVRSSDRGSKSRNKVSVGEPAEGSLSYPRFLASVNTRRLNVEIRTVYMRVNQSYVCTYGDVDSRRRRVQVLYRRQTLSKLLSLISGYLGRYYVVYFDENHPVRIIADVRHHFGDRSAFPTVLK